MVTLPLGAVRTEHFLPLVALPGWSCERQEGRMNLWQTNVTW